MTETLVMGDDADAPGRAVFDLLRDALAPKLLERAKVRWPCGHISYAQDLRWFTDDVAFAVWHILIDAGEMAATARGGLRDALAITTAHDETAAELRTLAAAIRRREVYNVIRRAAALLERLEELEPAIALREYADAHEPVDDGVAFSRIRRRRGEGR